MAIRNVPGTYPTIGAAVAASASGDTIEVMAGYANEFVAVTVNNLTFNWFSVYGVSLFAGSGVTAITLSGNSGTNVFGNDAANTFNGDAGSNRLYGNLGNDSLFGNDGNDWVVGGSGNDVLDGGAGFDVTTYEDATTGVTVNLQTGTATDGSGGTDTLLNIDQIYGSGFADTIILGNSVPGVTYFLPTVYARAGNDKITVGTMGATISGGSGADTIDGSAGFTIVNYFDDGNDGAGGQTQGVTANLLTGKATDNWGATDNLIGVENLQGSFLADSLTGDSNANTLTGNNGNDTISGGNGNDTVHGDNGNDVLDGGSGDDSLYGGNGKDVFVGGNGIDYFQAGAGNDTFDGGVGYDFSWWVKAQDFDTVDYRFGLMTTGVTVNLATGKASDGMGGTDTLKNIEQVYGSSFDDILRGGGGEARFEAFRGGAGNDTIIGSGKVNSRADYSDSTGGVTITLTGAADGLGQVTGGSTGTDTVRYVNQFFGSSSADTYDASAYTLSMPSAGNGFNLFRGGSGNDTIIGNGNTRLDFGDAFSGITIDLSQTTVGDGRGGIDTFSGVNSVAGCAHADTMRGTARTEFFAGRGGDDVIDGGGGFDEARYDGGTDPVTTGIKVNMKAGTVTGDPTYVGKDTLLNIEGVRGSLLNDTYVATGFASGGATDTFRDGPLINPNYNRFAGLSGNDKIVGNGQTAIDYRGASAAVAVTFTGQGKGTAKGVTEGTDTFSGVYSIHDSVFDDTLTGSNVLAAGYWEGFNLTGGNDTVAAGGGNDFLAFSSASGAVNLAFSGVGQGTATGNGTDSFTGIEFVIGSAQNDKMVGNAGNETFAGIAGNDQLNGGAGTGDTVSYFFDGKGVTVDLGTGKAKDGFGGTDTLAGFENITGSVFDDMLTGNTSANVLDGNAGADTMRGGAGNDSYLIDDVGDTVIEDANKGTDLVTSSVGFTLANNIENLTLAGTGALAGAGNSLANAITGNTGNNMIDGKGGNDTLRGLVGNDTFAFTTVLGPSNVDTIVDYSVAADTIRLENAVFTGLAAGTLAAAAFFAGTAAHDADDRIIYNATSGALLFDKDGVGGAAAIRFATVSAGLAMTNTEFVVV